MKAEYTDREEIKNALVDKFKARIGASRIPKGNIDGMYAEEADNVLR